MTIWNPYETKYLVVLIATRFYSSRVVSTFINENGTHRKEEYMWRKVFHDDLNTLYEKKQLIDLPSGGAKIISSPSLPPIIIPFKLREIPLDKWSDKDRIWLNM